MSNYLLTLEQIKLFLNLTIDLVKLLNNSNKEDFSDISTELNKKLKEIQLCINLT
jgi:hypothetical protein